MTSKMFLNISYSLLRIKLYTENQPPSLLNSGDIYIFQLVSLEESLMPKISLLGG